MPVTDSAFDLYDKRLQRWIWKQGWTELRDIQEKAAPGILAHRDLIIASATASGKTEAAYLPILTAVKSSESLSVLSIVPLKALINDQYDRLRELCELMELDVHRWHGDVLSSHKQEVLTGSNGVLLITPESLEGLLIRRGLEMKRVFAELQYLVIDELHAFIGTERGKQLQSLMHRIDSLAEERPARIALSATIGDLDMAAEFLRPNAASHVERVEDTTFGHQVKLQLKGYIQRDLQNESSLSDNDRESAHSDAGDVMIQDIHAALAGGRHLLFANSRAHVEMGCLMLNELCAEKRIPSEFWPHHGNLSREIREDAERALKKGGRPATIVATTTLELGIDVGSVESIAQIGSPPSVSAMRQRLGRSGRSIDKPSVLRIYVVDNELTIDSTPLDRLRQELVQSTAMVELLLQKWNEPLDPYALHLSTLVQQTLSLISEYGSLDALTMWHALCRDGPFRNVDQGTFRQLLEDLGRNHLISQMHDGSLVMGIEGERLVNDYEFYAAFTTPEEFQLVSEGKPLGTLPIVQVIVKGMTMVFAGKHWRVEEVDLHRRLIRLSPYRAGRVPRFGGLGPMIHKCVRDEMLNVYCSTDIPRYLDSGATELLIEARQSFRDYQLERRQLLEWNGGTLIFPWTGDRAMVTIMLLLAQQKLDISLEGIALFAEDVTPAQIREHLKNIVEGPIPDATSLASRFRNLETEKHHRFLRASLLQADQASLTLDVESAIDSISGILQR